MKNYLLLIIISYITLSCNKNKQNEKIMTNDSIQNDSQIVEEHTDSENATIISESEQIEDVIFAKRIKFLPISISNDEFGNAQYNVYVYTPYDGKFDKETNEFIELDYQTNEKIPQKFEYQNNILTLHRKKFDSYRVLKNEPVYNFNLYIRTYGVLAIDKNITSSKSEKFCGFLIYNDYNFEVYKNYEEMIEEDFRELNRTL